MFHSPPHGAKNILWSPLVQPPLIWSHHHTCTCVYYLEKQYKMFYSFPLKAPFFSWTLPHWMKFKFVHAFLFHPSPLKMLTAPVQLSDFAVLVWTGVCRITMFEWTEHHSYMHLPWQSLVQGIH